MKEQKHSGFSKSFKSRSSGGVRNFILPPGHENQTRAHCCLASSKASCWGTSWEPHYTNGKTETLKEETETWLGFWRTKPLSLARNDV